MSLDHSEQKRWRKTLMQYPAGFLLVALSSFVLEFAAADSPLGFRLTINGTTDSEYGLLLPTGELMEDSFWPNESARVIGQVIFHEERIIGGRDVKPSEAPYQVGILKKRKGMHCSGTLINRNTVLTAAHCFYQANIADFVFVLGKVDLRQPERTDHLTTATRYDLHPRYENGVYTNDAAIIKLKNPVCFNNNTKPLRLPTADTPLIPSGKLQISGWGYTLKRRSTEPQNILKHYPTHLKLTEIEYVPEADCAMKLRVATGDSVDYTVLHPSTFCAGVPNGAEDNCQGDSGGPVVCSDQNGGKYLCGIVSSGYGCGQPDTPGIYVNVAMIVDWIKTFDDDCDNFQSEPVVRNSVESSRTDGAIRFVLALLLAIYFQQLCILISD